MAQDVRYRLSSFAGYKLCATYLYPCTNRTLPGVLIDHKLPKVVNITAISQQFRNHFLSLRAVCIELNAVIYCLLVHSFSRIY